MEVCCGNCFQYEYIQNFINANGSVSNCDYCGETNTKCIAPVELADTFTHVVSMYKAVEDFMPMHDLKQHDGEMLHEKLQNDWGIFSSDDFSENLIAAIFPEDPYSGDTNQLLHSFVERENHYWGLDAEFSGELEAAWKLFCDEIIYHNRYFPISAFNIGVLDSLLPILSEIVPVSSLFVRARKSITGKLFDITEMGKPPVDKSKFGRANPRGISYLYLTSDPHIAVKEIRADPSDIICIGRFETIHSMKIINLTNPSIRCPFSLGDQLEVTLQYLGFLRKLGDEISKPIDPDVAELEYVPLQYLCEYFKNRNFDGIRFNSSICMGVNTTLFTENAVKCIDTRIY